jgi:hypothetical protein
MIKVSGGARTIRGVATQIRHQLADGATLAAALGKIAPLGVSDWLS